MCFRYVKDRVCAGITSGCQGGVPFSCNEGFASVYVFVLEYLFAFPQHGAFQCHSLYQSPRVCGAQVEEMLEEDDRIRLGPGKYVSLYRLSC